jgi:hypothetical protein
MDTTLVTCCTCDEQHPIEDTRKIKLNGLTQDFYICTECIKNVPLVMKVVEDPIPACKVAS